MAERQRKTRGKAARIPQSGPEAPRTAAAAMGAAASVGSPRGRAAKPRGKAGASSVQPRPAPDEVAATDTSGAAFLAARMAERPELRALVAANAEEARIKTQLRRARAAAGLTQAQLADAAGWKQPYVSRLERFDGAVPSEAVQDRWFGACGFEVEREAVVYRLDKDGAREVVATWRG